MVAIANKAFYSTQPLTLSITLLFHVRASVCVNVNFFVWIRFGVALFAYLRGRVGGHFSLLSVFLGTSDSGVNEQPRSQGLSSPHPKGMKDPGNEVG